MGTDAKARSMTVRAGGVLAAAVVSVVAGMCGTARGFDVGYHPMPFDIYALSYDGNVVAGSLYSNMWRATAAGMSSHRGEPYGRMYGGSYLALNDDGSVIGG